MKFVAAIWKLLVGVKDALVLVRMPSSTCLTPSAARHWATTLPIYLLPQASNSAACITCLAMSPSRMPRCIASLRSDW